MNTGCVPRYAESFWASRRGLETAMQGAILEQRFVQRFVPHYVWQHFALCVLWYAWSARTGTVNNSMLSFYVLVQEYIVFYLPYGAAQISKNFAVYYSCFSPRDSKIFILFIT